MQLPETKLKEIEARFEEVERSLADARPDELRSLGKEHSELRVVQARGGRSRVGEGHVVGEQG